MAVEPGARLADVLTRRTAGEPVEVVVSTFEDWAPPAGRFDAVAAFTAWHWLDPSVRTARAAAALRPGGSLVTVTTAHVAGGSDAFFADAQHCYERWDPETPPGLVLHPPEAVALAVDEVDDSPLFEPPVRRRYQLEVVYGTPEYVELLSTYSGHRALPPDRREGLLGCLAEPADQRYDGRIVKHYLYEMRIARRARR